MHRYSLFFTLGCMGVALFIASCGTGKTYPPVHVQVDEYMRTGEPVEFTGAALEMYQRYMSDHESQSAADVGLLVKPSTKRRSLDQWNLIWSDEFNESGHPDESKWSHVSGNYQFNNEDQFYTSRRLRNARVEDGHLILEAHKESLRRREYTSARLITRQKGDWKYVRIDVRAKLPVGRGIWPAIWMLPTDDVYGPWPRSGEIDIVETVGFNPTWAHFSIHTLRYNHVKDTQISTYAILDTLPTDFHVFSIEWDRTSISMYVDDTQYFMFRPKERTSDVWPFDQKFHLILNLAVGGSWGGVFGVDDNIFPQRLVVDYVRVYKAQ